MVKENNQIILDRNSVECFLVEKEKGMVASGARIIEINKKTEELKEKVEKTDKRLRFLL
ncbi:MAG: hypothetical protein Q8N63_04915 [Nanoarchaeota archaeon]|nr:hypothetical protein [Nanoarchaeota archaeon]